MSNNPTNEHREQAGEMDDEIESPQRVWLHVYADADCWCCYHFDEADDPRHLTEFVHVDILSSRDAEIIEVLEGLGKKRQLERLCFCDTIARLYCVGQPQCVAARALYTALQPPEKSLLGE